MALRVGITNIHLVRMSNSGERLFNFALMTMELAALGLRSVIRPSWNPNPVLSKLTLNCFVNLRDLSSGVALTS
jgi:hypothetical protein